MSSFDNLYVAESPWGKNGLFLKYDVCDSRDPMRVNWTCILMEVYDHERCLENGRFRDFERDPRENRVEIRLSNQHSPWKYMIAERVNWIAEHAECKWSLEIDILHVEEAKFYFSFDDLAIATMFKLVFA